MSPDEIRIAVAECCGWTARRTGPTHNSYRLDQDGTCKHYGGWLHKTEPTLNSLAIIPHLPNYPASLDACAEFEKTLKTDDLIDYAEWLGATSNEMHMKSWVVLLRATPLQRCEAFLRVKGKWREAQ